MALEYSNQTASSVIPFFEGASDVVVQVSMTCTNPDTGKFQKVNVCIDMEDFDPSSGFTNLADVTTEQLTQWATSSAPDYFVGIEQALS